MKINAVLHRISHLKWVFLMIILVLIVYCFIALPDNLISIIGLTIFMAGIQMGLESLSDVEKLSLKEQKRYGDKDFVRTLSRLILFAIIVLFVVSSTFISFKFVFPKNNSYLFNEFFNLGIDCWALILGFLCLLKSLADKHSYVKSQQVGN